MAVVENVTPQRPTRWYIPVDLSSRQFLKVAVVGMVVGAIFWALYLFLSQSVLSPVFCTSKSVVVCTEASSISSGIANVIVSLVGLFGLVRLGIFRPLFIVSATAVLLWGMGAWAADFLWYEALVWQLFIYGASYLAFSWIGRLRVFGPVLIISAIVILLARLLA